MKYSELKKIIIEEARVLKEVAAYNGAYHDGGSTNLLEQFYRYRHSLIIQYDLRPSEYKQLDNIEVGKPPKFSTIIHKYTKQPTNDAG